MRSTTHHLLHALALVPGRRPFTVDPLLRDSWGGPTLVGAWFVHAMAALGIQVICMAVIRRLHGRSLVEAVS